MRRRGSTCHELRTHRKPESTALAQPFAIRIRPMLGAFRGKDVAAAARVRGKRTLAPAHVLLLASARFHSSPLQAATDAKCPE